MIIFTDVDEKDEMLRLCFKNSKYMHILAPKPLTVKTMKAFCEKALVFGADLSSKAIDSKTNIYDSTRFFLASTYPKEIPIEMLLNSSPIEDMLERITIKLSDLSINDFSESQIEEITKGYFQNIPVNKYLHIDMDYAVMEYIRKAYKESIDITPYACKGFDLHQLAEIKKGLAQGIDISKYANLDFDADQMHALRTAITKGMDTSKLANPSYHWQLMVMAIQSYGDGVDLIPYMEEGFRDEQLKFIVWAASESLEVEGFAKKEYDQIQMEYYFKQLIKGITPSSMPSRLYCKFAVAKENLWARKEARKRVQQIEKWNKFSNATSSKSDFLSKSSIDKLISCIKKDK